MNRYGFKLMNHRQVHYDPHENMILGFIEAPSLEQAKKAAIEQTERTDWNEWEKRQTEYVTWSKDNTQFLILWKTSKGV